MTDFSDLLLTRHATKSFDPDFTPLPRQLEQLRALLNFAPSACNAQPWHFVLVASAAAKQKLAATLTGDYAYNAPKVQNASLTAVLCSKRSLSVADLDALIEQEAADGRFANVEAKAVSARSRLSYLLLHRESLQDESEWHARQVYIALGFLLLGAESLGLDACPLEGFDQAAVDAALDLSARGLIARVLVPIGQSAADDFNAKLPKSRLPEAVVISEI